MSKRHFVRLKRWLTLGSIGIMPRLIIAFATVAALAATANLIVDKGVEIVEQMRDQARERQALDSRQIDELRESMSQARRAAISAELMTALSELHRAAQDHADEESRASGARYTRALDALDRMLDTVGAELGEAAAELPALVSAHKRTADRLVESRRVRRQLLAKYSGLITAMDRRVEAALEQSWKTPARAGGGGEPLLEVRTHLDLLHQAFTTHGAFDAGQLETGLLATRERALATALRKSESALRRAAGPEWFQAMGNDLTALTATRVALFANEERRMAALEAFAKESEAIAAALPARLNQLPAARIPDELVSPGGITEPESPDSSLVTWISGIVLVLLLYLCFATIFSIVRPVRRLLAATHRLARGENAHVVPSGGIRELDTLTHAFNSMADQLAAARAAARDAQQRLEAKVEERTRQLQELAEQDPLTGIANRRQFFGALNDALDHGKRAGERIGVLFLDVDNFKTLNDSLGHPFGDRVLIAIARRLESLVGDHGFPARLGGDEFTVVLWNVAGHDEILQFGTALVRAFEAPLQVDDREVDVSVSVGASVYPDHERDAEALLRAADAALFHAKALGRSRVAMFTPELLVSASEKFNIQQRLRRALQQDEFELFFQPLIDAETHEVASVEALIRWRLPGGGYRAPDEFLPVAEESGLTVEINDWVMRTAIATAARWQRHAWPAARIAINVSSRQFQDHRFIGRLEELLRQHDLPARCLELELTESVLQTGSRTIETLRQLRAMGVAVALDDFGTGYSSLASLQHLPLTRVKLDRSLIAAIDDDSRSASIARATIALCRGLDLEVTAEGVERLEQLALLLPHRSILLQGFLLSRPVPAHELLPLISTLPDRFRELERNAKALPVQPPFVTRRGDRRRGGLTLVSKDDSA